MRALTVFIDPIIVLSSEGTVWVLRVTNNKGKNNKLKELNSNSYTILLGPIASNYVWILYNVKNNVLSK